jgi:5-formyltetrahydrofolate cyclo-ligase
MTNNELRQDIADKIMALTIEPKTERIAKYAPVTPQEIQWRAYRIAMGWSV